ncbi:RagB/SusD family nutrient uptake outer membrane protein [Epilithonimonas xixisoli]|uniref:Putative outer membrane starch-binding protein n=1 Tax=Epilithonimonas xixisoli TaxID=1476462 RepID=A0A4R8IJD3_9FLAO|nr:RagB/SusD family nutrient uptake outer membrane protein [Epilithonimonas xixisoli]TDX86729.1 putative outer membrane starch-binding protein [Epilithonimonas xixisoli]
MKKFRINTAVKAVLATVVLSSCSNDILEETPRATYTSAYFGTEEGVLGGITFMYANLRNIYGNGYWLNATETGTDEYTWGHGADGNYKDMDLSGVGQLTPASSRSDVLWNNAFKSINTSNGVIEKGGQFNIASSIIAEARFFRGFMYFNLAQTFGGVPLDLGSGELAFNTSTVRGSKRNTVTEVYTKSIFPDLIKAIEDLPNTPRVTGGVTKTVARLYLAKAYLTYAWWLQNPNNIPTYPETPRVDPNGQSAQWYFQKAYDIAMEGINNPSGYALQPTYYDVNVGSNDRHKEMLLFADHTETSEYYDGSSASYNTGSSPGNFAMWMTTWDYTFLESSSDAAWTGAKVRSVQRESAQAYGRPWKCMAPPIEVVKNTFADKVNDSRYDGTFVTTFRSNWNKAGISTNTLYGANGLPVQVGSAILSFIDEDNSAIDYSNSVYKSNVGAGVLPGRADFVIAPNGINRYAYPNLWKIGYYRSSYTGLGQPNGGSPRPFPIAKFSELYFVAAEAAVKGATGATSARDLINVIRARAGKWRFSNNGNVVKNEDNSAAMIAATPAAITIDYILAERSREYFGEGYRWHDLVRTQKWGELAKSYTIGGTALTDHTPKTYNRTISNYMYLRPIPLRQMESMELSPAELAAYQNPGY